jgi:hypothetical protein
VQPSTSDHALSQYLPSLTLPPPFLWDYRLCYPHAVKGFITAA